MPRSEVVEGIRYRKHQQADGDDAGPPKLDRSERHNVRYVIPPSQVHWMYCLLQVKKRCGGRANDGVFEGQLTNVHVTLSKGAACR